MLNNFHLPFYDRYFNSWIETYSDSGDDLKDNSTLEEVSSEEEYDDDDDDDDDDDFDYEDDEEQLSDLSTEGGINSRNLSRSSSQSSYIMFEASHRSDEESITNDDLSTLDDTFTSDDPLASIDSDRAKTKLLVDIQEYFLLIISCNVL